MYLPRKSLNYVALHAIWNQKACNTVHYAEQKTLGAKKLLYTMVWAVLFFQHLESNFWDKFGLTSGQNMPNFEAK